MLADARHKQNNHKGHKGISITARELINRPERLSHRRQSNSCGRLCFSEEESTGKQTENGNQMDSTRFIL